MENPYSPPTVEETAAPITAAVGSARRFTPTQVAVATFFGGLLAGGWLLGVNEEANGKQGQRWVFAGLGALVTAAVALIELRIDGRGLSVFITIASVSTAHAFAKQFERNKSPTIEWTAHSGWHVAGVAVACMVLTVAFAIGLGEIFPGIFGE